MDTHTCAYIHTHILIWRFSLQKALGSISASHICVVAHAEKLSTQEVGAGGAEVQRHSEAQKDFEAYLS